jgi:hypothetical protein
MAIVKHGAQHHQSGQYEDAIERYVDLFLRQYFRSDRWNFVHQYHTQNDKLPDIALENFLLKDNLGFFVPQVFVELKTDISKSDAVKQLMDAVSKEHGSRFRSRGFLIAVKGLIWTIKDYHIIKSSTSDGEEVDLLTTNFFGQIFNKGGESNDPPRPTTYDFPWENYSLDMNKKEDALLVLQALDSTRGKSARHDKGGS